MNSIETANKIDNKYKNITLKWKHVNLFWKYYRQYPQGISSVQGTSVHFPEWI
jgi:hypothetical protein